MEVLREVLIKKFTQAIREGNAGIFAGAGLLPGDSACDAGGARFQLECHTFV